MYLFQIIDATAARILHADAIGSRLTWKAEAYNFQRGGGNREKLTHGDSRNLYIYILIPHV